MIDKVPIETTLTELQNLYNSSTTNTQHQAYYSKMALMELCGWLEQTMDSMILSYVTPKLTIPTNISQLSDIIKFTHGFQYEKHFRKMLVQFIWLINIEKLETNLGGDMGILKSQLETLWTLRCSAAHNPICGVTSTFSAPSTININYLQNLYPILVKIESELGLI